MHYGVDLCAPTGTPVLSVDDGTVSFGSDALGGNIAVLHAEDGNAYYYAHMLDVQAGSRPVKAGDQIGRVDMTGNAQGTVPHTHFEWWPSGSFQRPAPDPTDQIVAAPRVGASPTSPPAPTPLPLPAAPAKRDYTTVIVAAASIIVTSGMLAWILTRPAERPALRARRRSA